MTTGRLLEIAAGTGALTRELHARLPDSIEIVATDLNQSMLDQAMSQPGTGRVTWRQADAMALPFEDSSFDAAVCQFGAMFFPDKITAFSEILRVLRPGGQFHFSVWDQMKRNVLNQMYQDVIDAMFPVNPPGRMLTPFLYHDQTAIAADLSAAGFGDIAFEVVPEHYRAASANDAAFAITQGHPVRQEIEERGQGHLERAEGSLVNNIVARYGSGAVAIPNQAIFVDARRPVR